MTELLLTVALATVQAEASMTLRPSKPEYPVAFKASGATLLVSLDYCLDWLKWHPPISHPVLEHYRVVREIIPKSKVIDLGPGVGPDSWKQLSGLILDALEAGQVYCVDDASGARIDALRVERWSAMRPCSSNSKLVCGPAGRRFYLPDGRLAFEVVDVVA